MARFKNPRGKKAGKGRERRVLVTGAFSKLLTLYLDDYAKKSSRYPATLLARMRDIILPQIKNFPESGRGVEDLNILKAFADSPAMGHLLSEIHARAAKIELREVILDRNFKILYGYDGKRVILLSLRHMAKQRYFL